jgi:hypothetical protein
VAPCCPACKRQEAGDIRRLADTCNDLGLIAAGHVPALVKAEPQAGCM